MNSRYFLTADSPFNIGNSVSVSSVLQTSAERSAAATANPRVLRPSRNSSACPVLIKLAMKISRARWYSFLRRVFHYQNGSGSELGPNPLNSGRWMLLEFVCLVFQISVTVYTLIVSGGENPVWPMRLWVSGYAFGCFFSIVLLHWRYRVVFTFQGDPNSNDVEQQRSSEESRNLQKFRTWVELLFAIWFVMGNIWVFDSRFGSYNGSPKLHVLCVSLLAWNAVSYSFPFILFVLLCCCVPFLSGLLGYNINTASLDRGATDDQIATLPSWKYREEDDFGCDLELGDENDLECCICLAKYREKEEMRELPCNHIFHRSCVDQWLKIISCCPLCKQQINK